MVFATQALDEIARLPNIGAIVSNIATQIFLPSMNARLHAQAELYRQLFGTTDAQLALLAQAVPKRDYLLVRPSVTRLVHARMPPALVAINEGTTQEAVRTKLRAYASAGGAGWELRFLREVLDVQA